MIVQRERLTQFVRFGVVGLGSNALLYAGYIAATSLGMRFESAMSLFFGIGVLLTFTLHKRWTFAHEGSTFGSFVKYVLIYAVAYVFHRAGLLTFVDVLEYPHQLAQGLLIPLTASMTFALQKAWAFHLPAPGDGG